MSTSSTSTILGLSVTMVQLGAGYRMETLKPKKRRMEATSKNLILQGSPFSIRMLRGGFWNGRGLRADAAFGREGIRFDILLRQLGYVTLEICGIQRV
jgi:hypothetical protein